MGEGEEEEDEGDEVATTGATKQEAQVSCYGNIFGIIFFTLMLNLMSTYPSTSCCMHKIRPLNLGPKPGLSGYESF